MRAYLVLLYLSAALSPAKSAYAFELDYFKTGMTKEEVELAVQQFGFKFDWSSGTAIVYRSNAMAYTLVFCQERLVQAQKELPREFNRFIRLVSDTRRDIGPPTNTIVKPSNPAQELASDEIMFEWIKDDEQTRIGWIAHPNNNQLYLLKATTNSCFDIRTY